MPLSNFYFLPCIEALCTILLGCLYLLRINNCHIRFFLTVEPKFCCYTQVVMKSLGMSRTVIYRWLSAANTKGVAVLRSKKSRGHLPKLSARQQQDLRRIILTSDPRSHGYEKALWSTRIIKELIANRSGQSMSRVSVASTLHKLEIYPTQFKKSCS
jgi:transposase